MLHKYDTSVRVILFWELKAKIVRFADTPNCLGHSRATPRFYNVKPHCYYRLDVRFQNMFQNWSYDINPRFVNWRGGRVVKALDC